MDSKSLDLEDKYQDDEPIGELYIIEFQLDPSASSRNFTHAKKYLLSLLQSYVNVHMGDEGINLHASQFYFHEVIFLSLWVWYFNIDF